MYFSVLSLFLLFPRRFLRLYCVALGYFCVFRSVLDFPGVLTIYYPSSMFVFLVSYSDLLCQVWFYLALGYSSKVVSCYPFWYSRILSSFNYSCA